MYITIAMLYIIIKDSLVKGIVDFKNQNEIDVFLGSVYGI